MQLCIIEKFTLQLNLQALENIPKTKDGFNVSIISLNIKSSGWVPLDECLEGDAEYVEYFLN